MQRHCQVPLEIPTNCQICLQQLGIPYLYLDLIVSAAQVEERSIRSPFAEIPRVEHYSDHYISMPYLPMSSNLPIMEKLVILVLS